MREEMLEVLHHSPRDYGIARTRWRIEDLIGQVPAVKAQSKSGLWRVLQALDLSYRRGWGYVISPDPFREAKLVVIEAIKQRATQFPTQVVVLWLDELTIYRLPSLSAVWDDAQGRPTKARYSSGSNTDGRIVAALNHVSGQVHYVLRSRGGVRELQLLYQGITAAYPQAQEIYVIQDCWPVHFLPEVCHCAVALGITLVPLPTYSSWRNPIEKLWRWLKQDVLHMHPWCDQWQLVKDNVVTFLDRFQQPNSALLHYVGLSD